jgi:putative ABC transport system permease protein
MNLLRTYLSRVTNLLRKNGLEKELDDEMRAHLELLVEEKIRKGMSALEAGHAARREFGGLEQNKELYREQRGLPFLETLLQDLRYALRTLHKNPSFAAIAILTLALGMGANTAIFSVVYGIALRPLPFPQPERVVQLVESSKGETQEKEVTYQELQFLEEHRAPFAYLASYTPVGFNLALQAEAERVNGLHVSSDYFQVLGIKPILGRDFQADEDQGGGARVALLSEALWKRDTGADPKIIGRIIKLDGEPFTVIGVLPAGFERINTPLTHGETELWVPLALVARTVGSGQNLAVIGRLRNGVTLGQGRAQMEGVSEDFRKTFANELEPESRLDLSSYQSMLSNDLRTILFVLFGAVAFVLLIACANVANLLLGRAAERSKEIAIRLALGASRTRLIRQMITESILLSLCGALGGLLLARYGLLAILAIRPANLPRAADIHLDVWAFVFALTVALLAGIGFGLAPALKCSRSGVSEALKESTGRASGGRSRVRLRGMLAVSEIALSLMLLTGATLLIETFWRVLRTDPGFNPSHILTTQIWLSGSKYDSMPKVENFYEAVLERMQRIPGVQSAAVVEAGLPIERGLNMFVQAVGQEQGSSADYRMITPHYFQVMGIPVRQGRAFLDLDGANSQPVAIVNETFARQHWPQANAVGQYLKIGNGQAAIEVVGVAGDVKSYLDRPAEPSVFVPASQSSYEVMKLIEGWFATAVVVRAAGDPSALGQSVVEQLHAVNPSIASGQVRTMEQIRSEAVAVRQFNMVLLSLFAALAVLLAAIGIYGVMAYNVTQRAHEIGVRLALGAHPRQVLRLVLGEGLAMTAIGVLLGIAGGLALTRLLQSYLYEVKPTDLPAFLSTALFLGLVALAACWIPARRAMRLDPLVALRYE